MLVISWLAEYTSTSQEGPCFVQLVNSLEEALEKLEEATGALAFIDNF